MLCWARSACLRAVVRSLLIESEAHGAALAGSVKLDLNGVARGVVADGVLEICVARDLFAVNFGDYITLFDAGLIRAASARDASDVCADRHIIVLAVHGAVAGVYFDAHIGLAGDVALGDKVVCDGDRVVRGYREAYALNAGGAVLCVDDADYLTLIVIHGAAGVARS